MRRLVRCRPHLLPAAAATLSSSSSTSISSSITAAAAGAWRHAPHQPQLQHPQLQQPQLQHLQQQQTRCVWNEPTDPREARKADSFYDSTIEKYAELPVETLSLEQMLHIGRNVASDPSKVIQSARFVQEELPKRLARRLLDMQLLPHLVVTNPHIRRVYEGYFHAFETLRQQPRVASLADNAAFCSLLRRLVDEHAPLLDQLARGLVECRAKRLVGPALQLDSFLDNMLRSRISRRVMAEQHLSIASARPGYIGSIATALDVADAVAFAGQRAAQVCAEAYGVAPEVILSGDRSARLPYLPGHLDYMLYELLKNGMRAVVERHRNATYSTRRGLLAPITARICSGGSHLTIRISDQGGGIPPQHLAQVWSYGFTTSPTGQPDYDQQTTPGSSSSSSSSSARLAAAAGSNGSNGGGGSSSDSAGSSSSSTGDAQAAAADAHLSQTAADFGSLLTSVSDAPRQRYSLAGLGFGLPMSRLYARYFGGDLRLVNLPGYGVDVFLVLGITAGWTEQLDEEAAVGAPGGSASDVAVGAALRVQQSLRRQQSPS